MTPRLADPDPRAVRRRMRRHRDLAPARAIGRAVLLGVLVWAVLALIWLI